MWVAVRDLDVLRLVLYAASATGDRRVGVSPRPSRGGRERFLMGYDPNYSNSPFQQNQGYPQQGQGYPGAQAYGYPAGAMPYAMDIGAVMRQVYLWLALGLAVGFGLSFALGRALENEVAVYQAGGELTGVASIVLNPVALIVGIVAYLVIGFGFYPIVQRASVGVGAVLYVIFAAIFGFFTSVLFLEYTAASIFGAFIATAGMFAVMSLIGYTTKMDLSRFGAIFFMALIGLIIASLVNFFLNNTVLYWVISYAGVVIFAGLTAYDTQWIKKQAAAVAINGKTQAESRVALIGAFKLFLDFINLFLFLVRILGRQR
jgi:FtsH-binding integral membrane protein